MNQRLKVFACILFLLLVVVILLVSGYEFPDEMFRFPR